MKINWKKLAVSLAICFLPAILGSVTMIGSIDGWYSTLNKPWFTPPNWIFGPVWTTLYILMGISLYLIWNSKRNRTRDTAIAVFGVQLILNGLWSPVFFFAHSIVLGLVIILILDAYAVATILMFYNIDKRAGCVIIPYIIWLCIATLLNFSILVLN